MRGKGNGKGRLHKHTTLIAEGTRVVGDVHFHGSLEIEGRVEGNLVSEEGAEARVRVLETGHVEGEVNVPLVVVNGTVEGTIQADKQVQLGARAVVQGDIHYDFVEIEKGAQVNGSFIHMSSSRPPQQPAAEEAAGVEQDTGDS